MKSIGLTEEELEVLNSALVRYGAVVTFDQLADLFNNQREYLRKRISKLSKQGWLKRIKKGIFVISDLSSRGTLSISHYTVTNILVENAYISFESALQYHGLYDQLLTKISSVSMKQYKDTVIDGYTYTFAKTKQDYYYGWQTHQIDGQSVKIACIEKALIDLIQFHRNRYTIDLVLEKLINFKDDINPNQLVNLSLKANITTQRITGFLLDCLQLNADQLFIAVKNKKSTSKITNSENNLYNSKWKLYYDKYFSKYAKNSTHKKPTRIN